MQNVKCKVQSEKCKMKNKKSPSHCGTRQEQRESSGTPPVSLRDAKRQRSAQRLYGRSPLLKKNGAEL